MRIIAHTKYGVFEGTERQYDKTEYKTIGNFLEKIADLKYFSFETDKGEVYMTEQMINDTLFILEK